MQKTPQGQKMQEIVCHCEKQIKAFITEVSVSSHLHVQHYTPMKRCRGGNSQFSNQKTNPFHFLLIMSSIAVFRDQRKQWICSEKNMSTCMTFRIIRLRYNCNIWHCIRKQLLWNYSVFFSMNEFHHYFLFSNIVILMTSFLFHLPGQRRIYALGM